MFMLLDEILHAGFIAFFLNYNNVLLKATPL